MTKVKSRRRVTNARGGTPQLAAVLVRLRRTKQDYEKKERIFYMRPDLSRPRRAFMDQLSLLSCDSRMIRSRFFSQASRSLSALSRVFRIARNANSRFAKYFAVCLTSSLAFNVIFHVFVCTGLMPTTGQPMPFIRLEPHSPHLSLPLSA